MACTLESTPASYNGIPISRSNINTAISRLNEITDQIMTITNVPGISIAVVWCGETVYAEGFGVKNVVTNEPIDPMTVFPLASLSKPIGATVIARVITQTEVKWDDPIIKYIPTFELSDKYVTSNVTIGDMYSHRSGLPTTSGDSLEDLGFTRDNILEKLRYVPLLPFRLTHQYANFGTTIGGVAVANSQNMSWELLSKTTLYEPLGMVSTSSSYKDFVNQNNRVTPYQYNVSDGTWVETIEQRNPDEQSPAGGVSSNVIDVAEWMKLILSNGDYKIKIDTDALYPMLSPQIPTAPQISSLNARPAYYGFGIGGKVDSSGRVQYSHSGVFLLGAATCVTMLPSERLGIVVLTNGSPLGIPEAISQIFLDLVEYGNVEMDWVSLLRERLLGLYKNPSILAEEDLSSSQTGINYNKYTGTFSNNYYGPLKITLENNKLVMYIGTKQFDLTYWHNETFYYYPTGENSTGVAGVFFTDSQNCVRIENLEENLNIFCKSKSIILGISIGIVIIVAIIMGIILFLKFRST